jgi:hypothetical protein
VPERESRLFTVRLAQMHAACAVLDIYCSFDKNDSTVISLGSASAGEGIEDRLFAVRARPRNGSYFSLT